MESGLQPNLQGAQEGHAGGRICIQKRPIIVERNPLSGHKSTLIQESREVRPHPLGDLARGHRHFCLPTI